ENTFNDFPDDLKRERSKEYGLVYVYRKNEIRNIHILEKEPVSDKVVSTNPL
ncbi:MAG: hypothetical protein HC830_02695, partial [Bacteroidetes bacterium]|nr:hypothetical protein [Bacteroidota bacterium]